MLVTDKKHQEAQRRWRTLEDRSAAASAFITAGGPNTLETPTEEETSQDVRDAVELLAKNPFDYMKRR